jgi:hypothetical protein
MDKGQYMPEVVRFSSPLPPIGCRAAENNLDSINGHVQRSPPNFSSFCPLLCKFSFRDRERAGTKRKRDRRDGHFTFLASTREI